MIFKVIAAKHGMPFYHSALCGEKGVYERIEVVCLSSSFPYLFFIWLINHLFMGRVFKFAKKIGFRFVESATKETTAKRIRVQLKYSTPSKTTSYRKVKSQT